MAEENKRRSSQSLQRLRKLVSLMNDNSLVELELEEKDFRVRLVKAATPIVNQTALPQVVGPVPAPPVTGSIDVKAPSIEEDEALLRIKSPIVGTFYHSPAPDAPCYVTVGDHVNKDTVVCIIEAMKVMNELKAEISGTIVKILGENAQTVEYGQPLFLVRPD